MPLLAINLKEGNGNTVFVEQPYLPNGIDKDFIRWLYTALNQSQRKIVFNWF